MSAGVVLCMLLGIPGLWTLPRCHHWALLLPSLHVCQALEANVHVLAAV